MIRQSKTRRFSYLVVLTASFLCLAPWIASVAAFDPVSNPLSTRNDSILSGAPGERFGRGNPPAPMSTFLDLRGLAVDSVGNVYVSGTQGDHTNSEFVTVKYTKWGKQAWVSRYSGPQGGHNYLSGVAVDSAGNAYVTGASENTPGSDDHDFATVKYDSSGKALWVKRYAGPAKGSDWPTGIAVDSSGNSYVTGDNQISNSQWDFTTVKYDKNGNALWSKRYNGPYKGSSRPSGIALDSSGNTYVTGDSQSGKDSFDFATVKYNKNGKPLWSSTYKRSGSQFNFPCGSAVSSNYLYVAGSTQGKDGQSDFTVVKNNSQTGKPAWAKAYDSGHGADNPAGMAVDGKGNSYLTGESNSDFLTIKYDSSGKQVWINTYSGTGQDRAKAVALDSKGNAYVTGQSYGEDTGTDFATVKYASGGKQLWVQRFNGKGNGQDYPAGIAVDSSGNVYVTGQSQLTSAEDYDFVTVKYDSAGKQAWVQYYSGQ